MYTALVVFTSISVIYIKLTDDYADSHQYMAVQCLTPLWHCSTTAMLIPKELLKVPSKNSRQYTVYTIQCSITALPTVKSHWSKVLLSAAINHIHYAELLLLKHLMFFLVRKQTSTK